MSNPLAILTPGIGAKSETFIRRHIDSLLPGKTVAVASTVDRQYSGGWTVDCPTLIQDRALRRWRSAHEDCAKTTEDWEIHAKLMGEFFREHRVEAAMAEYLDWGVRWLDSVRPTNVRYYAHAHGYDISWKWKEEYWRNAYKRLDQCDGVITMNRVSLARLVESGVSEDKIHVVPYGVDVPGEPTLRSSGDRVRCLAVGRMVSKKAPILLLDGFRRALKREPNLVLDYVGDGELMPAMLHYIQAHGLKGKVILHGPQPHEFVLAKMREADIFVQHSVVDPISGDEEGLPVAILEAMAHGLPVLATRHAGIPESVEEGKTGLLVDEGDTRSMAEHIVALAHDETLRCKMGHAGWQTALECFTWEKERQGLLNVMGFGDQV